MEYLLRKSGSLIIALILISFFFRINGFFIEKSEIIKSDGLGYYSYLPAIFIYGDYSQDFLKAKFPKYYKGTGIPAYMQIVDNKPVDKYFFGTSVLMYPFFMTAHLLSICFNKPTDGYSVFYQYFAGFSAIFYSFLGIFFCGKLFRRYGATVIQSFLICALLAFATNLFFYITTEPTMSHAFSFAAVSAFLFFLKCLSDTEEKKYIIPIFISLGLIILIRPFNGLIILAAPFVAGSFDKFIRLFRLLLKHYAITFLGSVIAFLLVSAQFWIWYKQTGHLLVYSYTNERFYFDRPHVLNVLFSYQKGIFIYTPLCFLSLAGFYFLFRKNKFSAISLFSFFAILIYCMSCWHEWYYGSSFGFRPFIEYLPLTGILFLYSLQLLKQRRVKYVFIFLCLGCLYINQVQAYQYRKFIIHWDKMSKYKYWKVFLKTGTKWSGYVWDNPEPSDLVGRSVKECWYDFEKPMAGWTGTAMLEVGDKAYSGKMVTSVYAESIFSNTLKISSDKKIAACTKPALIATGYIHPNDWFSADKLKLAISYENKDGSNYFYRFRQIDNLRNESRGWKKFEVAMYLDPVRSETDSIKLYFWSDQKKSFFIDDVDFEIIDLY